MDLLEGMMERHWLSASEKEPFGRWVYEFEMREALDAAQLAISEYYNGDRAWAEWWLIKAAEANK
jgi:hypothetical protein